MAGEGGGDEDDGDPDSTCHGVVVWTSIDPSPVSSCFASTCAKQGFLASLYIPGQPVGITIHGGGSQAVHGVVAGSEGWSGVMAGPGHGMTSQLCVGLLPFVSLFSNDVQQNFLASFYLSGQPVGPYHHQGGGSQVKHEGMEGFMGGSDVQAGLAVGVFMGNWEGARLGQTSTRMGQGYSLGLSEKTF